MDRFPLQLNREACIECGSCQGSCPFGALTFDEFPTIDPLQCKLCGACVDSCPVGALELNIEQRAVAEDHSKGLWVFVEICDGVAEAVSLELLTKGAELALQAAQELTAITLGEITPDIEQLLYSHGADYIIGIEDSRYEAMIEEHYAKSIASLVRKYEPSIFLIGATAWGRSLSARLAATLETGLTADCTSLSIERGSGLLLQRRPAFGGELMATIKCAVSRPQMASVRPGIFKTSPREGCKQGVKIYEKAKESYFDAPIRSISIEQMAAVRESLSDAKLVIGVGRGVKDQQTLEDIYRLAEQLGAVVAGTRGAVEMGLIPVSHQIGQTGKAISADCYLALGISGQIQHTAALANCKKIIAVNNDKSAPIFKYADYALVADVKETLRTLISLG